MKEKFIYTVKTVYSDTVYNNQPAYNYIFIVIGE